MIYTFEYTNKKLMVFNNNNEIVASHEYMEFTCYIEIIDYIESNIIEYL